MAPKALPAMFFQMLETAHSNLLPNYIIQMSVGLAFWMLRPERLRSALSELSPTHQKQLQVALEQPARGLSHEPGSCALLFSCTQVLPQESIGESPLRSAFILPVRWHRDVSHSSNLPPHLHEIAEQAKASVLSDGDSRSWGLHPDDSWSDVNLSEMTDWRCDSAWASLAAGLVLAQDNLPRRPGVFASVAWAPGSGVRPVGRIAAKLAVTKEFGGERCFVAGAGLQRGLPEEPEALPEVRMLAPGESRGRHALLPLLQSLQHKPGVESPLAERCLYANRFTREQRVLREEYIASCITHDLVQEQELPGRADALVMIVSNRSGALLSLLAARPSCCLLIYTARDSQNTIPSLREDLVRAKEFRGRVLGAEVRATEFAYIEALVAEFLAELGPDEQVWFDCTGGKSGMKAALLQAAFAHQPAGIFYLDSDSDRHSPFHQVGTEKLRWLRWPAGVKRSVGGVGLRREELKGGWEVLLAAAETPGM